MQDRTQYQEQSADGALPGSDWPCFTCHGETFQKGTLFLECGWHYVDGHPMHPQRCPTHNQAFMRWKRGQDWKRGINAARLTAPAGRKRLFLITWTQRDSKELAWPRADLNPDVAWNTGLSRHWDVVPEQIARFRRMSRTVDFRDMMPAGMWAAECTEKYRHESYGHLPAWDWPNGKIWWHVHPHIHTICFGGGTAQGIDLPRLRRLARRYGFGEPDVQQIKPASLNNRVGYLVNYFGKDQLRDAPLGKALRSRDTWGIVREECANVRRLRKEELAAERNRQHSE